MVERKPQLQRRVSTADILVVDIDPRKGGDKSYKAFRQTHAILGRTLPRTAVARTWSGGWHEYYRLPPGVVVRNTVSQLGQGIDTRGFGGLVVGPGSEIDGKRYEWVDDVPLAVAADWFIDECRRSKAKSENAGQRVVPEDDTALTLDRDWLRDHSPFAEQGERGFTAYKVACSLFDYGVSESSAIELMEEWNEAKCDPPMELLGGDGSLEHAVRSAQRNKQNAIGSRHPDAPGFEACDPHPERKPDAKAAEAPIKRDRRRILTFAQACAMAFSDTGEPLVEGVINCNEISIIYGAYETGKSFVQMDMDYHIAAGMPWFGREVKQGAVLYVAAEGSNGATRRFEAMRQRYGKEPPLFVIMGRQDLLNPNADTGKLIAEAKAVEAQHGYKIIKVSIDTVSKVLMGGDDSGMRDMSALADNFQRIQEALGCHVAAIHHAGLAGGRTRGSTALPAAIDTEIEVTKPKGNPCGKIEVKKQKEGEGHFLVGKFKIVGKDIGVWPRTGKPMNVATIEATLETFDGEPADAAKANAPIPLRGERFKDAEKLYWAFKTKADAEQRAIAEATLTTAEAGAACSGT